MNTSELVRQRLHNQKLLSSNFQQPAEVVRWFGAMQAQDFNAAKWAIALRMRNATSSAIEEAFNQGHILRTHLLRPTWHFVTPEDIRSLLELTAPRVNLRSGPNYRKYELDGPTFKRSNKILTKALQDGKHLTRSELKAVLNRSGVAADDLIRLAHIMLRAELDGVVCSGRRIGKQFTYALLEERVAPTKRLSRDEALATLTRRYFMSHGPATLQDFTWWSGLSAVDAHDGVALVQRDFAKQTIDGKVYWAASDGPVEPSARLNADSQRSAHLLPAYDEYNVAYKDRRPVLDVDGKSQMTTWDMLSRTVSIDGKIVGTWQTSGNKNSVTVYAARTIKKAERLALATAVERYAMFLDVPAVKYSMSVTNFRRHAN